MLNDTHAHLYVEEFDADREAMLQRAADAGVSRFFLPNIDSTSIEAMLELERQQPEKCFAMMGLHPCSVKENYREELAIVQDWLARRPFCAVGEMGIDLYWDKTFLEQQKEAFRLQVEWAKELQIPIVIHSRDSLDICIELVKELKDSRLRGIFHCFGGTLEQAQAIMDLEFYMGIGGVLTFKKAGLDEVLRYVPLDFLVLETDAPYLSPIPFRGKRNESAYVKLVAEKLSQVKETSLETVAAVTTVNAEKIFFS
ncbi:MAG: TatD family hydrolase [Bacteroidota bacterium]